MSFFTEMGPLLAPMLVLAGVVVVLAGWRAVQLFGTATPTGPCIENGINSVLFWGVVAFLVGLLGFFAGVYYSLSAWGRLDGVGFRPVALGVAESLACAIFGLAILLLATAAWFFLRSRHTHLMRTGESAAT